MNLDNPVFTFGIALAGGMIAQVLAQHLRMPGIVLLLLFGVLLGPDLANVVRPETLGTGLRLTVGMAVAVILFEGGLHLDIHRLRGEAVTIRRLVTIGAAVTAVGGALAGRYLMGWGWQVAVPFGTLVVVTGPTVITPLLRRIRIKRNLHTILEAEGVLIDPIAAIIAVVALEIVLAQELDLAARGLLGIPSRLLLGAGVGMIGGLVIGRLLAAERLIPERYTSVFTLALLLALWATAEVILPDSGIMAAPIAGMVVGNTPALPSRELKEFKEQLTVLLVGLLFVLLAADVRLAEVRALGAAGVVTVATLMFVVRPLDVAVSTAGSGLTLRERAFLAWLAPRGIVAAAVASLFAAALTQEGIAEGRELRALVFLVIAATVLLQGLGGGLVAALLGVRRPSDTGYLIVGAHPLARALAWALKTAEEDVVLVDTDTAQVVAAEREGLAALWGNALDEEVLQEADVEGRHGVVGLIPNEGVSLLVAEKARREFRVRTAYVAFRPGRAAVPRERLKARGARILFGTETDIAHWSRELEAGRTVLRSYRYTGDEEVSATELHGTDRQALPLLIKRRGLVFLVDDQLRVREGDVVTFLQAAEASVPRPAEMEPLSGDASLAREGSSS